MKKWRIFAFLMLGLITISAVSCGSLSGEKEKGDQFTEVERGELTIMVSGTGNIEVSNDRQLSFGISGKVETVNVEEGDAVKAGDILATLDTDALELAVTQARFNLSQAKAAVTQAGITINQSQFNIEAAEYDLDYTEDIYLWTDVSAAQGEVEDAEEFLASALIKLSLVPVGTESEKDWQKSVFYAERRLKTANNRLDAMLSGTDTQQIALKKQQLELAVQALTQAVRTEELAKQSEELAAQTLEQAVKQLEDATLTAPFSGIVVTADIDIDDLVSPTVPVIYLINTDKMELNVDVDEVDIALVKEGQEVVIELDALPEMVAKGQVGYIREIPRKEGGVILYRVKIEFDVPKGSGIRSGMSANADIILEKRTNVLLIPSRAVQRNDDGDTVVEISIGDETEERTVKTGLNDGFQVEIISGLKEGEVVVERRN